MKTRFRLSVTFEYLHLPPTTWRGEIVSHRAHTALSRGVLRALRERRPQAWSSMVAVILERSAVELGGAESVARPVVPGQVADILPAAR